MHVCKLYVTYSMHTCIDTCYTLCDILYRYKDTRHVTESIYGGYLISVLWRMSLYLCSVTMNGLASVFSREKPIPLHQSLFPSDVVILSEVIPGQFCQIHVLSNSDIFDNDILIS